jgi:hypothetical protein
MAVVVFTLIFIVLALLSLREKKKKVMLSMIFSSFLVTALGGVISIFVIDKYTKKAKILSYTQKRNLANETIMFEGKIQNIGNFKIGYCTIEVKLSNNAMKMGRPKEAFFKPSTSLGPLFSGKEMKANVVKQEFKVAKNLPAKKVKSFRFYMKYPPYMNSPGLKLTLNCH